MASRTNGKVALWQAIETQRASLFDVKDGCYAGWTIMVWLTLRTKTAGLGLGMKTFFYNT